MKKIVGLLLVFLTNNTLETSKTSTTKFPGLKPLLAALTNSAEYQKMSKLEQATLEHYVCATKNLILGILLVPVTLYCAHVCLHGATMYFDERMERKTGRGRSNSFNQTGYYREPEPLDNLEIAQILAYYWAGQYSLVKSTDLLVDAFYRFGNGPQQRKKDETRRKPRNTIKTIS